MLCKFPNVAVISTSFALLTSISRTSFGFNLISCRLRHKGLRCCQTGLMSLHRPVSARRRLISPLKMANENNIEKYTSKSKDGGLFLFDFDGVVCDSCDECTVSAWRTCHLLNALRGDTTKTSDYPPQWLFDKMREIRPAIEVGWQIPVLLSVFLEQEYASTPDKPAMTVSEILANYESLVEKWLEQHNLTDKDMIRTFGKVRDDWIADNLSSWLDINVFYDGISQGISKCTGETALVTTKQQRFANALVRHAGIPEASMPDESIYGLGMYKSKSDVIVERMTQRGIDPANTHFFEDRWPTIDKCLKDERLDGVKFYLCSWGYCTKEEIALASSESRVQVLSLDDFEAVVT